MKKAVIAWGRMNPVTSGHEKLVNKVLTVASRERAEPRIYLSHTQNPKKDPLQYKDKIAMAKKAFGSVMKQSTSRTLIQLMQELQRLGFTEVTMVAGSDRVNEYKTLLNKYNSKEYNFDSIKVISAGQRDPDAEGTAGMSATKLRKAAADGDLNTFMSGVPSKLSKKEAEKLYTLIRKGMMVEELIQYVKENREMYDDIDEYSFTEEELDQEVYEYSFEELEEEEEVIEEDDLLERAPLTIRQRIAKSRQMKRLAPKLKRMRQVKKFRVAPTERLMMRARKMARNLFRKRFAGKKGEEYAKLKPSEKINIDRLIASKTPAIEKLAKRLLPKVRKAEIERVRAARTVKNETIEQFDDVFEALFEATKTRQDSDIKDRQGTQPARYHTGLAKSTKAARDAHFKKGAKMDDNNPAAYKPAPGDKEAETKPSKWTKKYKDLFGEQDALDRAQERIKREKQALKIRHDRELDNARMQDARAGVRRASKDNKGVSSSVSEALELSEKSMDALKKKAEKSGYSYGTLKKVYDRGVAAWRTGHRPGTTPQQWGYARVNAFIAKQKTGKKLDHDTDLANEYVPEERKSTDVDPKYGHAPSNHVVKRKDDNGKTAYDVYNEDGKVVKVFYDKDKAHDYALKNHDALMQNKIQTEGDGLWHNIHKKRREGRPMREPYSKGAPTKQDFKNASEEAPVIDGKKMHRLGSKPGSYKALVKRHLGAKAAEKIDKSDGNKLVAKGKRTGNKDLVRKGSFIKNVIAKEDKGSVKHHLLQPSFKHAMQHAKIHIDKDNDGDVDNIEKLVPDELTAAEKNKKLLQKHVKQKHSLEKQMAKKRVAFEETQLDESLQIERGAGFGTFLTASDLGMKIKAGYVNHPSVEEEHGAGEEGTDKLVKKYKKDTPGQ